MGRMGRVGRSRKVSFKFLHTLWVYRLCICILIYEIKIVTNILMGFKISRQFGGRLIKVVGAKIWNCKLWALPTFFFLRAHFFHMATFSSAIHCVAPIFFFLRADIFFVGTFFCHPQLRPHPPTLFFLRPQLFWGFHLPMTPTGHPNIFLNNITKFQSVC